MFTMFSVMTGWRWVVVVSLHLVMFFCLALSMVGGLDNYILPSRIGHPETYWHLIAIALVATVLIIWLVRSVSFVWPTLAMATAFVFLIESFRLFNGEMMPDRRIPAVLIGMAFVAIYWVLSRLSERLMLRYNQKMFAPN